MSADGVRLRVVKVDEDHEASTFPTPATEGKRAVPSAETAFRLYSPYVAAIAFRLLGSNADVDDVVQDVFLAGHRGLGRLEDPAAIRSWLATVTVRVAKRKLWARKFRSFLRFDDAPDYANVAAAGASEHQRALLATLYSALDELPVNERIAWTLRHIDGEDLASVARACGCSLATIKRRIAAAEAAIQEVLGDE